MDIDFSSPSPSESSDNSMPNRRRSSRPRKPIVLNDDPVSPRSASSDSDASVQIIRPRRYKMARTTSPQAAVVRTTARMSTGHPRPPAAAAEPRPTSSTPAAPPAAVVVKPPICCLCHRSDAERDDFKARYFRMDSQGDLYAHYLCMFTASNLHQTGDPRAKSNPDEICGFLCANVKKEKHRAGRLKCRYCKKHGAAVGCAVKACPASYHYPCGLDNGCFFHFTGSFESFCPAHIPKGAIPRPRDMKSVNEACVICMEEPPLKDKTNTLITPCCHRALHRLCLSTLAVNAGKHYIKCPSCNVADNFKAFCEQVGVHVPNADATWLADEEAERAREDQEPGPELECAAGLDHCMCPHGLTFDEDVPGRDWNVERCAMGCGTFMHAACMKHVGRKGKDYRNFCPPCFEIDMKINKQLGRPGSSPRPAADPDEEKEESPEIPEIPVARPAKKRGRGAPHRTGRR